MAGGDGSRLQRTGDLLLRTERTYRRVTETGDCECGSDDSPDITCITYGRILFACMLVSIDQGKTWLVARGAPRENDKRRFIPPHVSSPTRTSGKRSTDGTKVASELVI